MYSFLILLALSFLGTYYVMPHSIRKLRENGYVVKDMYKQDNPLIPTNAGMILLFTSFISISLLPLVTRGLNFVIDFGSSFTDLNELNLAFLLVVSVYALYGLVDDLVDINRKLKIILPISFSFPLISLIHPESIWIPFVGDFNLMQNLSSDILWNDAFRLIVIPVYVMVVSNLVNMHSGYNGLQTGLSIIILSTLLVKSWQDDLLDRVLPAGAFLGAMMALLFFNKYPAKVFEGNIGSLLFGSVIGSVVVIQQYWWFGFFILLPHIFNLFLWVFWILMMKRSPEQYLERNGEHRKFGSIRKDNSLEVPNRLTLKWIPNYYFVLTEKQTTPILYLITLVFCFAGIIIF